MKTVQVSVLLQMDVFPREGQELKDAVANTIDSINKALQTSSLPYEPQIIADVDDSDIRVTVDGDIEEHERDGEDEIDWVTFAGQVHKVRTVFKEDLGVVNVSTETLNDLLAPEGDPINDEAAELDSRIAFFVPEEILDGDYEELVAYVEQHYE